MLGKTNPQDAVVALLADFISFTALLIVEVDDEIDLTELSISSHSLFKLHS